MSPDKTFESGPEALNTVRMSRIPKFAAPPVKVNDFTKLKHLPIDFTDPNPEQTLGRRS